MSSRVWNIVLHFHGDGTAATRVSVNGRTLLPSCEGQPIAQALAYAEAVLVDFRPEDRLAVRAQGLGMLRNFQPSDGLAACAWLSARAHEAREASASHAASAQPTATGTRSVVRALDGGATAPSKSSSS